MIKSFADKRTSDLFKRKRVRRFEKFERVALRKLILLNAVAELADLAAVPGNKLEALKGNRFGQYSIRINRQWRVCFNWNNGEAENVEICDYH